MCGEGTQGIGDVCSIVLMVMVVVGVLWDVVVEVVNHASCNHPIAGRFQMKRKDLIVFLTQTLELF